MEKEINSNSDKKLSKEEIERYCRQIILPEIAPEGQTRIKNAKVLVVGAGGLGSPCLMYLAGAGIGEIGIVDGDCVDHSNLHRQVIHQTISKGVNKAKSSEMFVKAFNPLVKVNIYEEHLTNKNALEIASKYDMIIDCCDNPGTRYLTSDVAVILNIPLVSGSAVKWEGQLTLYVKDSINSKDDNSVPCYRCLFPIPTPNSSVCNCADAGVFGPVPGVIGTMQANEAVKVLIGTNRESLLSKRMLMYNAYDMNFKIFKLRNRKSECISCGNNPKITKENLKEYDYDQFVNPQECRVPKRIDIPKEYNIKWKQFIDVINNKNILVKDKIFLDVRPNEQFTMFNFADTYGFINYPLKELLSSSEENNLLRDKNKEIYVMCRGGNNSTHAVKYLIEKEYKNVFNIQDGLHGYIKDIDNINTPFY